MPDDAENPKRHSIPFAKCLHMRLCVLKYPLLSELAQLSYQQQLTDSLDGVLL